MKKFLRSSFAPILGVLVLFVALVYPVLAQVTIVSTAITTDSATFNPGGTTAITVTGLTADTRFTLDLVNAQSTPIAVRSDTPFLPSTTTYTGTINPMPVNVPYGVYTFTVRQGNLTAEQPITVARTTRQYGSTFAIGAPARVTGSGWDATTPITVSLNATSNCPVTGTVLANVTSNATGQWGSGVFNIPAVAPGTWYFNATDGTNCVTAQ